MAKRFTLKQFMAASCYSYVISSGAEAMIIDPHISLMDEYISYLNKKSLKAIRIIDTHTHADHFSLAAVLKERLKVPVLMHEKAISKVADERLKEGDEIILGDARFSVIYAPGHTDDTLNLYGEGVVLTGDVLLIGSVGRTDFQNGSPESMFDTLKKLKALPDTTAVYPAHDYNGRRSSTIGKEKKTNPFMKESDRDAFVRNAREKKLPKPFNIDNIIRVNREGQAKAIEMVSPDQARELIGKEKTFKLLDVRSPGEFSDMHIKDSVNIPIDTLAHRIDELSKISQAYIVLCRTGNRSPMAADLLMQSGISPVKVMEGGMTAWKKKGLPVIKGEGGMSLERQIRVIAGSLVLFGIVSAWLFDPVFILVSLFVSTGLIFAGLTDTCLMGMLLMKLPYNKKMYKARLGGGTCSISQ
jgi:glyoxylase-like metal-dependent hydrolase (beta-lactamase superfamily II)/rhodanese-related sulfurtransferase